MAPRTQVGLHVGSDCSCRVPRARQMCTPSFLATKPLTSWQHKSSMRANSISASCRNHIVVSRSKYSVPRLDGDSSKASDHVKPSDDHVVSASAK